MSYNLTPEELHEMRDWSSKAEQLVRLGMLPVGQLPYIKRALKVVQADAFLPLILRKPFYKFIEELMELALGEPGIYRLIRNKVAANRNDSVINRYMPEETTMVETQELNEISNELKRRYEKMARGDVKLLSKAIKWHQSKDRPRALMNKKIDAKLIAKHQATINKRNKGIASATEVKEQTLEEAKTSFKKLLRPNFYKDEKAKANVTQTAKIADDAHSKAEVTEDCKKLVRPNPYKDEKAKANVTLTAKIADDAHSKAKVTEERDADERAGDREERQLRRDKVAYDKAAVDKAIASSKEKIGKKEASAIHRLLKGRHESVEHDEELELLNANLLDEDVNYRTTPQGMLQTMSNIVKIKKRHGGKVNVNDRKVASKARNELRRRKYFNASASRINSEFDASYLDLADVLAEEGIFLDDQQLDELKKATAWSYLEKRGGQIATMKYGPESLRTKNAMTGPKQEKALRGIARAKQILAKEEVIAEVSDTLKRRYAETVEKNFKEKGIVARGRKQFDKVTKRLKLATTIIDKKYPKLEVKPPIDIVQPKIKEKPLDEETLTEISDKLKDSYLKKAEAQQAKAAFKWKYSRDGSDEKDKAGDDMYKRDKGMARARARGLKESVEPIHELKKETLGAYAKKALLQKSDADFNLGLHAHKKNQNQDYPILSDRKEDGGLGDRSSVNKLLRTSEKRGKGIVTAVTKMASEAYKEDYPEDYEDASDAFRKMKSQIRSEIKHPKKIRPSRSTWYKSAADAGDVKDVNPKMNVRFNKEEFEKRFARTLELFEVSHISELDEEMTKMFLSLVQSESKSDEDYVDKVYDKIRAAKTNDSTLTPEQIRYRAEKKARAAKTQAAMDAAKKELSSTKIGTGWSKVHSDTE